MRQYLWTIKVEADEQGMPRAMYYQNRWWRVSNLIDSFRFGGRWWLEEPPRTYYLVELEGRLDVEIYRAEDGLTAASGGAEAVWVLARVQD